MAILISIMLSGYFYLVGAVDGAQGERGQLPYPAGIYDNDVVYECTTQVAPYVSCEEMYYVMQKIGTWQGSQQAANVNTPKRDYEVNKSDATWLPFEDYKAIWVEVLMADFGKLAGFVFHGNNMFSQQGVDANGTTTDEYKDFGTSDFTPNILINGLTGEVELRKLKATGQIMSIHSNGNPASILNYKDDNVSYPGVSLWYDNGQVMECRQFDYDASGSMIGAETLVYDNTGKLLYKFDRLGIRKAEGLEQYWTYADRYAYRTATAYSTGQALLDAIADIRLEQYKSMPTNATLSTFHSEEGKDNSSYDNKVFYGAMATGSDPIASSLFTGYVLTQSEPMTVSDTHFKRDFYRYVEGVKQTAKLTVTLPINPI